MKWIVKKILYVLLQRVKRTKKGLEFILMVCLKDEIKQIVRDYPNCLYAEGIHIEKVVQLLHLYKGSNENPIIIDVGAAKGDVTDYLFEKFPDSKIYAFEPIDSNYNELEKRFKQKCSIITRKCALGSRVGTDEINVTSNIGSSSICKPKIDEDNFFKDKVQAHRVEQIRISTLDEQIQENETVDLIKIDVQGYELEVLKGGEKVLEKTDIVLIEMLNHSNYYGSAHYYEIDQLLRLKGFKLLDIIPSIKDGCSLMEWDGIYVKERVLSSLKS